MVAAASILDTPPSALSHTRGSENAGWLELWSQHGWLCLSPPPVSTSTLSEWLCSSVESELARLAAVPRPDYVSSAFKPLLEDQIYRARMLGFQGLAIQLPSLQPWAVDDTLSPEDSAALLTWCDAARELGVPLRLCAADDSLRVYEAPVVLSSVTRLCFPLASNPSPPAHSSSVRDARESGAEGLAVRFHATTDVEELKPSEALSSLPAAPMASSAPASPVVPLSGATATQTSIPDPEVTEGSATIPSPAIVSRRAAMRSLLADDDERDPEDFDSGIIPAMPVGSLRLSSARLLTASPAHATAALDEGSTSARPELVPPPPSRMLLESPSAAPVETEPPSAEPEPEPEPESALSHDEAWAPFVDAQSLAPDADTRDANRLVSDLAALTLDDDTYSRHVEGLQATGGSHGWDDIERLFETHYLPLQKAVRDGAAPVLAAGVLAEWAKDFAESYERAFEAIRSNRGKKPRLVLEVPSYAFQVSRKHDAEHLKMVLVDGLRADVGAIVQEKLRLQMANTAQCVASGLLWSALPANTSAQMELIARGSDGLRHFSGELSEAQLMSRGNDLRRLRPVRVGSHRMYKLDIVQYLAKEAERHTSDNLEQYAAEVATSVGRFLRQQEPSTLVYLFGDHGFGGVTNAAPEQVLTPYQAWLIGA